jgi:hypothetical protein
MKIRTFLGLCLLTLALLGLFTIATHAVHAGDTNAPMATGVPPEPEVPSGLDLQAINFVLGLLFKYPKLTALAMLIGSLRTVMKPITLWLEARVKADPIKAARLTEFEQTAGPIFKRFCDLVDLVTSVKLPVVGAHGGAPAASAVAMTFLLSSSVLFGGCVSAPSNDVVSVTESAFGLRLSPSPSGGVPNATIGFSRLQYHRIPTSTNNVYAPSLISGINIDTSFTGHNEIDEQFATGLGIGIYDTNRLALAVARARANAAATNVPGVGVNAPLAAPVANTAPTIITNADGSLLITK